MTSNKAKGMLSLLLAVIFFSIGIVAIRMIKNDFSQIEILFWRTLVAAIVLGAIMFFRREINVRELDWKMIKYGFLAFFLVGILIVSALFFASVANVMFLDSFYIIFNILLSDFMLGEKFSRRETCLTLLGLFGVGVIFLPVLRTNINPLEIIGMVLGLLSGLAYSTTIVYSRILRNYEQKNLQFWGLIIGMIFTIPLFLLFGNPLNILSASGKSVLLLIGGGLSTMLFGFYCLIYGMKHIRASVSGIILLLEAPLSVLFALVFIGEIPTLWTLVGGGIILLAGGLIIRNEYTSA